MPDPTNPVSIPAWSAGVYQFLCDPPETPPAVTPSTSPESISTVTFTCDLTSVLYGDMALPIASLSYNHRGCYVTTPNSASVQVPAEGDISQQLEDRLGDGVIVVSRVVLAPDGTTSSEVITTINFDSWSMRKTEDEWVYSLAGTKVITYSAPMHRTVESATSRAGDFTDYAKTKELQLNGIDAAFLNPGDYVAYGDIGLYVDKLVGRIWDSGYEVTATQFGRFI